MASCKLACPTKICSDNRGVVHALNQGEFNCLLAPHKDEDIWILVWEVVNRLVDEKVWLKVTWVKAHTTDKQMERMSPENWQIAHGSGKADEFAGRGAELDGAEVAQVVAKGALERRRETCAAIRYAAEFHCKAGDLVDFEEGTENEGEALSGNACGKVQGTCFGLQWVHANCNSESDAESRRWRARYMRGHLLQRMVKVHYVRGLGLV